MNVCCVCPRSSHVTASQCDSFSCFVCVCVSMRAWRPLYLRLLHPHNSLSLFPRQLLREQLSGTERCCKVGSPPDRATRHASRQHNTRALFSSRPVDSSSSAGAREANTDRPLWKGLNDFCHWFLWRELESQRSSLCMGLPASLWRHSRG